MITVKPDPAHPRGGFAELSTEASSVTGDTVEVVIFDSYSSRYLGESGWQATRHAFGPYIVDRNDPSRALVIVGPEIVNQIDEYAAVKVELGQVSADINWPEEIVPAPGAARIEGINTAGETKAVSDLSGAGHSADSDLQNKNAPTPPPPTDVEKESADAQKPAPKETPGKPTGGLNWIIPAIALLAIVAGVYFYQEANTQQIPPLPAPPVLAEEVTNVCDEAALRAIEGFAGRAAELRKCAGNVTADTTLSLLEEAAQEGDGAALALFGTVYDAEATDVVIESVVGLTFDDAPATAADYYARALTAGREEAREPLEKLCIRMADMNETLIQSAVQDHCNQ